MTEILYRNNDQLIELIGLKDAATGSYINDATVTVTLKDIEGNTVTGQAWPAPMLYVAASQGDYQAILEDTLELTIGEFYVAEISATKGTLKAFWELPMQAHKRT